MGKKRKGATEEEAIELIARFSEGFKSGKMNVEEGERIIGRLRDLADDAVPRVVEMLASPDEDTREVAIVLLRELGDTRGVGPLKQMLFQPEYSDEEKMKVLQALDELGAPVDEHTFHRAISDPDALVRRSMDRMLEMVEDPVQVEGFLEVMGQGLPEMQEHYVLEFLAPRADRRLLLLLAALLHSDRDDVVVAAVDAIERVKEPATIPLLEERAQCDPSRRVRRAAENAALRLRTRVGAPQGKRPSELWLIPSPLPVAYCLLSTIDGSGGQVLFVARERPEGNLQVVDLMFNDHQGIKDCFSGIVDEEELGEMMAAFENTEFADISLERVRAEVARAYQITLDARRRLPPAFIAWQGWIEGGDPRSLEEFPLPSIEPSRQAKLLSECAELLTLEEFTFWFFNPDEVQSFIPRYRRLFRRGQIGQGEAPFEALLDQAIETVIDDQYRRILPDRLRRQAWLLAQVYEDDEVPLWALAAAAAFEEGVIVEHPLMRDMMARSFLNAVGRYL